MPVKVLVCPLNWGLGHATRCIPVIRAFLERNCTVTVAASGASLELLRQEFGNRVVYEEFPGKQIRYSRGRFMILKLTLQLPAFLISMVKEHLWISRKVKLIQPQIVISDNRYGARSKHVLSVFISHQVFVQMPPKLKPFQNFANYINHIFLKAFDHCWAPDMENPPGLSGALTHHKPVPFIDFIGPLSRFRDVENYNRHGQADELPENFILVILSGPEPQRTILEEKLQRELKEETVVWFRALPGNTALQRSGNHFLFNHGSTALMGYCIQKARMVISRSGYTTVMDLEVFGKKAVLIPTPGQTEQEYLAQLLDKEQMAAFIKQKNTSQLQESMKKAESYRGIFVSDSASLLRFHVDKLLKQVTGP